MVNNSLAKAKDDKMQVEYESNGVIIKLSPASIRKYLVNGNGNVTDQEVVMFLNLCRAQRLNPYLREAYLVKYGDKYPATIVTGKEVFTKRARRNKDYAGFEAGIIVQNDSGIDQRAGAFYMDGENVVGGWAKVHIKGYSVPVEMTVSMSEYIGRKSGGEVNSQWAGKPATMIRKVALVQALREAFPEDFQGLYDQSEIQVGDIELDESPMDIPQDTPTTTYNEPEAEYDPLS